jgi:hypothetical protein
MYEYMYLTSVVIISTMFWDMASCSPLKFNMCFEKTMPPSSWSKNKPSKEKNSMV